MFQLFQLCKVPEIGLTDFEFFDLFQPLFLIYAEKSLQHIFSGCGISFSCSIENAVSGMFCNNQALSYAIEAHRLRTQLFQEKFSYSVENSVKEYNDAGDISQKLHSSPKGFKPSSSVASEVWSFDASSWNVDGCYLSPWNVLQCYLESVLQV